MRARGSISKTPRLAGRFEQGRLADAFLAAQVEWLSHRAGIAPALDAGSRLRAGRTVVSVPGRRLRTHLLLDTPDEFRNRNLLTTPEARITVGRGRPLVPETVQREKARLRQQRYRRRLGQRGR